MKSVMLKRIAETSSGTFGILIIDGLPQLVTIELPWHDNELDISCVPVGNYTLVRYRSEVHGLTWQIVGVPDRDPILFHVANTLSDIKGCIGVGLSYGRIGMLFGIRSSRTGMELLRNLLGDADDIPIVIQNR